MLELEGKHGNLGNQEIATDEGSYQDDPLQTVEYEPMLLQTTDERTPEEGIGRCRQTDEAQGLTLIEVELGQSQG